MRDSRANTLLYSVSILEGLRLRECRKNLLPTSKSNFVGTSLRHYVKDMWAAGKNLNPSKVSTNVKTLLGNYVKDKGAARLTLCPTEPPHFKDYCFDTMGKI